MLGMLSLSDVQGPMNELQSRLGGNDGQLWLDAFKRFLRKENPWINRGIQCRVKASILIGDSMFEKMFDLPIFPFIGMTLFDTNEGYGDPLYIKQIYCELSEDIPLLITFENKFGNKDASDLLNGGWKLTSSV